jgi:hypothetical protein
LSATLDQTLDPPAVDLSRHLIPHYRSGITNSQPIGLRVYPVQFAPRDFLDCDASHKAGRHRASETCQVEVVPDALR